jgi:hypothetical protein
MPNAGVAGPGTGDHRGAGRPGRTVERSSVVPSALRTLSVVTLLSAVSGAVMLTHQHHAPTASAVDSAVLAGPVIPQPRTDGTSARMRSRIDALARNEAIRIHRHEVAVAAAHRQAVRDRITRSAVRDPQAVARLLLADRGWGAGQFSCLKSLWDRESRWNYRAANPSSGAYGIAQALPGRKMAAAGADWRTNPVTQMKWGLGYIAGRYGTPCGAWWHSQATGWY